MKDYSKKIQAEGAVFLDKSKGVTLHRTQDEILAMKKSCALAARVLKFAGTLVKVCLCATNLIRELAWSYNRFN